MNVVIVEDEPLTANELKKSLIKVDPEIKVLAILESVKESVEWFSNHTVDLIFMDIHLGDGSSFSIFDQISINSPIIFTTAYDEYALRAFEQFSIAYLLKPVEIDDVKRAVEKYKKLMAKREPAIDVISQVKNMISAQSAGIYQKRFMVSLGSKLKGLEDDEIAYFKADGKLLMVIDKNNKKYFYNSTLQSLEEKLDPKKFFRINRKYIVNYDAIDELINLSKSRIKVKLIPQPDEETGVIISSEKSALFKNWMNQ